MVDIVPIYYSWLKAILIVVAIISLGTLAVNQTLGYYYKSKFLQTPCELCKDLNPHLEECFEEKSWIVTTNKNEINYSNFSFPTLKLSED